MRLRPNDYDRSGDIIPDSVREETQGEWIEDYTAKKKRVVACNKCHCLNIMGKSNFCPNCGLKMLKGGKDNV